MTGKGGTHEMVCDGGGAAGLDAGSGTGRQKTVRGQDH